MGLIKQLGLVLCGIVLCASPAMAQPETPLEIQFVGQQVVNDSNSVVVLFNQAVDATLDINPYFRINRDIDGSPDVDGAWILNAKGDMAFFTNVDAGTDYTVTVRSGLRSVSGQVLELEQTRKIHTRDVEPSISFSGKGHLLPMVLTRGIPVDTLDVSRAEVDFFRVRPARIVSFVQFMTGRDRLDNYNDQELRQYAEFIYTAGFDLDVPRNVRTTVTLPIADIPALATPGVYAAVLRAAGDYAYSYPITYFTLSDMGLHARLYPKELRVTAQSLSTGIPLSGVALSLYQDDGRVASRGTTNSDGVAAFPMTGFKPGLIVAEQGKSLTVLAVNGPALDLAAFDIGKRPFQATELFIYSPRNLYRPGETIIVDGLLRDCDGNPTVSAPIKAVITRPDGREAVSFTWQGDSRNAFHYAHDLTDDAPTGTWTLDCSLAGNGIGHYTFQVEDFMPERMKLTLGKPGDMNLVYSSDQEIVLDVVGEYLYGAPAAGNRLDANVSIRPRRELLSRFPGFEFGDSSETYGEEISLPPIVLDDAGKGRITVKSRWQQIASPLLVRMNVNLYEQGGRPVSRVHTATVWPADTLVGLRPVFGTERPDNDSDVEFEVIRTNQSSQLLAADTLSVTVIREYPETHWELDENSGWRSVVNFHQFPVNRFELSVKAGETGRIHFPVEWGGYRVEVLDPKTGLVTSYRFETGWRWWGARGEAESARPDQVVLTLDRPSVSPGQTVVVTIKPPEAGMAQVSVESDAVLWQQWVPVDPAGTRVDIPISDQWNRHDIYVTAMVLRPGDQTSRIAPKRSLGVLHLPLYRDDRRLSVALAAPDKIVPNQEVDVDIQVTGQAGGQPVYITLAAVDVGVLGITRFQTPDPADFFFGQRRYGVDAYDVYQKLIEDPQAKLARMRYGGGMSIPELARGGGKPMSDVRIVSVYQGNIVTGADGKARVRLDIPDFNGRLRLMAVAHGGGSYGNAEQEVTVAAPVVTEIAMPRFLAFGDSALMALDVQNLSGRSQALEVGIEVDGPIAMDGAAHARLDLADQAKTTLTIPVRALEQMGAGTVTVKVSNIHLPDKEQPVMIRRQWILGTRPAYPAITRQWHRLLQSGESLALPDHTVEELLPSTTVADLTLSDTPSIALSHHIQSLYAYPYGCLEQTVSGIYPQIYLGALDLATINLQGDTFPDRMKKIQTGIARIVSMQKSSGGFGLWSADSPEEPWLTCYAADFLLSARQEGFSVPEKRLAAALQRLNDYLRDPRYTRPRYTWHSGYSQVAVQSYAGFVLARDKKASLGSLRTLVAQNTDNARSGLALVHTGLALYLSGDTQNARKALSMAGTVNRKPNACYGDYGSTLRDAAMAAFLLEHYAPELGSASSWLAQVENELQDREWFSTQERNALVLVGLELERRPGREIRAQLGVNSTVRELTAQKSFRQRLGYDSVKDGLTVTAMGDAPLYATILLSGYGIQPLASVRQGIDIRRSYYDVNGNTIVPDTLRTGDLVVVRLDIANDIRVADALVVDLLPAGLELENQNLSTSFQMGRLVIDGKTIAEWKQKKNIDHEEYRDDRYVAALDLGNKGSRTTLFYLARAVTPGSYRVPNPHVEDMYRPNYHGVGETLDRMTITNK